MIDLRALIVLIVGTFLAAIGAFYFKKGSTISLKKIFSDLTLFKGLSFYGLSGIFYLYALNIEELSVVYPFVSLTYVWMIFLSKKYLNEQMNPFKYVGLLLIFIGIVCIGMSN